MGFTSEMGCSEAGSIDNSTGRRVVRYRTNERPGKRKPFPKAAIANRVAPVYRAGSAGASRLKGIALETAFNGSRPA